MVSSKSEMESSAAAKSSSEDSNPDLHVPAVLLAQNLRKTVLIKTSHISILRASAKIPRGLFRL